MSASSTKSRLHLNSFEIKIIGEDITNAEYIKSAFKNSIKDFDCYPSYILLYVRVVMLRFGTLYL